MKTTSVSVVEAKQNLSDLLRRVADGKEVITITRRGKPIAKVVPVGLEASQPHIADAQGWLEEGDTYFKVIEKLVTDRLKHVPRALAKKRRTK